MDCSLCLNNSGVCCLDLSILYSLGRLIVFEEGFGSCQGRKGLTQNRSIVVVLELDERLACLNALIVTHIDPSDGSGNPCTQRRHVSFQVGVIRLLVRATPLPTRPVSRDTEEETRSCEQHDRRNDQRFFIHALGPPDPLRLIRLNSSHSSPHSVHAKYAAGSVLS